MEINEKYEDQGVKVISIDSGVRSAAASALLDENGVTHIVLNDLTDEVMTDYRIVAIPVTVIIDHEGRVMFRHLGFADEMVPRLESEIEMLIAWRDAS